MSRILSHQASPGMTLSLVTKEDRILTGEARLVLKERNFEQALALEIYDTDAFNMNLYQRLKTNHRLAQGDYFLGEKHEGGKTTAYLAPMHDSMMAMTETGLFNVDIENKFRDAIALLSRAQSHEH